MQKLLLCVLGCISLVVVCLLFEGCSNVERHENTKKWMTVNGKMKVLCTTAMVEALVKNVVGVHADTLTLISGQMDPHSYQLVKGDDEKLAFADIIFYSGLGLEHGPSLRHFLSESSKATGIGDFIKNEHPELLLYYNGTVDPHLWMDISLWAKTITLIVEILQKNDPAHAAEYLANGKTFQTFLFDLHAHLVSEMETIPAEKRFLVTSHDAFNYFARSYLATPEERRNGGWQKRFAAPEGLAPESQLSTTDIRNILEHMKKYDIHVIFPESNVSQASIKKLVSAGKEMKIDLKIASESLYGDAMGPVGSSGDSYPKMIEYDVKTIQKYLNANN